MNVWPASYGTRRTLRVLSLIVSCLALTSCRECVTSRNPISDPNQAQPSPSLLGTWVRTSDEGTQIRINVTRRLVLQPPSRPDYRE